MEASLFLKYQQPLKNKIEFPSDVLKLEMQEYFKPKDKREKALLFGAFAKYQHEKIRDAFLTCQKSYRVKQEEKYKSILYLIGIIKRL